MDHHEEIREKLRFSVLDSMNPSGESIGLELMRMVKAVQDSTLLLNSRLERHMEIEEVNMELTRDALQSVNLKVDKLTRVLDAFPTDEAGHPDVLYHRGYHEDRRSSEQSSAKLWGGVRQRLAENAANAVMVVLILLLFLGAKEWIMSELGIAQTTIAITDTQKGK